jgi:hypothetical protein
MPNRRVRSLGRAVVLGAIALCAFPGCSQGSSQTRGSSASASDRAISGATSDVIPPQAVDTVPRDSVAELPRVLVELKYVQPTGRQIRVDARGNLQSALNQAEPGDVVLLAPGATYEGSFTLPRRACNGASWITVRTDVPDAELPAPNARLTPAQASRFAKIVTASSTAALKTANPTCGWWLMALEVTASPRLDRNTMNYGLLLMGDGGWRGGGEQQTALDKVPTRLVLDRVFVHGLAGTNSTRCIALNSSNSAIINSRISDCHAKGFDSQAIEGWNGPGPYLIENNFIAGAGENIMFGGADPGIKNLVPSDITIRRNHVYKDPAWKGLWTVKNLFELKNARRVLIEANVFENNWADAQAGMAIVIKSSHDACTTCTWQGTQDVTFRYNIVRNSPRGFNLQAVDGESDFHVARVRAEHNLFQNIGTFNGTGQDGWLMLLTHDLRDIAIRHNTFVHNVTGFGIGLVMDYADGAARNVWIDDNVFTNPAGYAIFYSGKKVGIESLRALAGDSWSFARNVVAGVSPEFVPWHPPGSWYPSNTAAIGFLDPASGDYRLAPRSTYKGRGKGGTDPGVDMNRLRRATDGVVAP